MDLNEFAKRVGERMQNVGLTPGFKGDRLDAFGAGVEQAVRVCLEVANEIGSAKAVGPEAGKTE